MFDRQPRVQSKPRRPWGTVVARNKPQDENAPQGVRVLVSVMGVHRGDTRTQDPASVEIQLYVQNTGASTVALRQVGLELISTDLRTFHPSQLDPPDGISVWPGQTMALTALFPVPDGDLYRETDLPLLMLNWTLESGKEQLSGTTTFQEYFSTVQGSDLYRHFHDRLNRRSNGMLRMTARLDGETWHTIQQRILEHSTAD